MGPPPCLLGGRAPPSSSLFLSLPDPGSFEKTKGEAPRTRQNLTKATEKKVTALLVARFTLARETNQVGGADSPVALTPWGLWGVGIRIACPPLA